MVSKITVIHASNYKIHNHQLKQKMVDFTGFYINRISQNKDIEFVVHNVSTFDAGLQYVTDDSDYVLLITSGNRLYNSKDIIPEIVSEFEKDRELSMMGHILDRKDNWYEVHHQFVFVRTSHWIQSGRPKFGIEGERCSSLPNINRSYENFHDDYTPLWVTLGEGSTTISNDLKDGWSLLSGLLRNGFKVKPFTQRIRSMKGFCYPEYNSDKFYDLITDKRRSDDIDYTKRVLLNNLLSPSNSVWVFNTEEIKMTHSGGVYDVIATPCAGFKFLDILKSNLLVDGGKVVFYDFNDNSIEWFRYLMSSPHTTIEDIVKNKPPHIPLKGKRTETLLNDGVPSQELVNLSNEVYDYFGGVEVFGELLNKFRMVIVEFISVNLIDDPTPLTNLMVGSNNLINLSNIFSTDYLNLFYGEEERNVIFNRFINHLYQKTLIVGRGVDTYYFEKFINNDN